MEEYKSGFDYYYTEGPDGITLVGYFGEQEIAVAPEEIDGKPVIAIGNIEVSTYEGTYAPELVLSNSIKEISYEAIQSPLSYSQDGWVGKLTIKENHPYFSSDGRYLFSKDGTKLICCIDRGNKDKIEIPQTVEEIGDHAFWAMPDESLEKVVIPKTVRSIGDRAFYTGHNQEKASIIISGDLELSSDVAPTIIMNKHSGSLIVENGLLMDSERKRIFKYVGDEEAKTIQIPDTVEVIDNRAFARALNIRKLQLNNNLRVIGDGAFASYYIVSASIPASVEYLAGTSFNDRTYKKLSIDENNTHFRRDEKILYKILEDGSEEIVRIIDTKDAEFTVPGSVHRVLEEGLFNDCNKLLQLTFSEGVEEIDEKAFWAKGYLDWECKIKKIEVPSSVRKISFIARDTTDGSAPEYEISPDNNIYFEKLGSLYKRNVNNPEKQKDVKILPETVVINEGAFSNAAIKKIIIPEGVTKILKNAFNNCKKLERIDLPSTVSAIDRSAFASCTKLKVITIAKDNESFVVDNNVLFTADKKELICYPLGKTDAEYHVPDTLEALEDGAFNGEYLRDIYFAKDIPRVSTWAFRNFFKEAASIHAPADSKIAEVVKRLERGRYGKLNLIDDSESPEVRALKEKFSFEQTENGLGIRASKQNIETVEFPTVVGGEPVIALLPELFAQMRYDNMIKEIIIPEGIKRIEADTINRLSKLEKVVFPKSVEYIDPNCFAYENGYQKDLYLRENTIYIVEPGSYAEEFLRAYEVTDNKWKLRVVTTDQLSSGGNDDLQETLKYMDYKEDNGTITVIIKSYLEELPSSIRIPEEIYGTKVTKARVSYGGLPDSVQSIYISSNIEEFEVSGNNLRHIEVHPDNKVFSADGHALYSKDGSKLIEMLDKKIESYHVLDGTKTIGYRSFFECPNLVKVSLPSSVKELESNAFCSCNNLEEIDGIENIEIIGINPLYNTKYERETPVLIIGGTLLQYKSLSEKKYVVPEGVVSISDSAFWLYGGRNEDKLEEVVLPSSLKSIGSSAFKGRTKIKTITIPSGVEKVGGDAFRECDSLEKITLSETVNEIGKGAFPVNEQTWRSASKSVLKEIEVLPQNKVFKSIDGVLFSANGEKLIAVPAEACGEEYIVPETVKVIGEEAFLRNPHIKNIILGNNVEIIERNAFASCPSLESINLNNVKEIGEAAFSENHSLKSINLNAIRIGDYAFCACIKLANVTLTAVKEIGNYAFSKCKKIKTIDLPDSLQVLGDGAFSKCSLKQVIVPKSVLKVGYETFSGCPDITLYDTIDPEAKPSNEWIDDTNGSPNSLVGFIGIGEARAMKSCAANHDWLDYEITVRSADTNEIKYKVWMGADPKQRNYYCMLSSSWGKNAGFNFKELDKRFSDVKGTRNKVIIALNRIVYPIALTETMKEAYAAYLVRQAKETAYYCIDKDDMESFLFCETLGVIKKNHIDAMLDYAVKAKATQFSAYLMEYKESHFGGAKRTAKTLQLSDKVPEVWQVSKSNPDKVARYAGADKNVVFPSEIKGKKVTGVASVTKKVPDNYREIVSVVLPEGYTTIGDYAFFGCENLESITLPSTLVTIGRQAFRDCKKLKSVTMPDSVLEIGEDSFGFCTALTDIRLSRSLKEIPKYAFQGCDSLVEIELPESVEAIMKGCFVSQGLKKITVLGNKMIYSGQCFYECPEVYAHKGVMEHVYGITRGKIHILAEEESRSEEESVFKFSELESLDFKDKSFVLTGFGEDEEKKITELIENKGGSVKSGVSGKTDYLIVMENYGHITTKYKKAIDLNEAGKSIGIIGSERFYEFVK